MEQFDEKNLKKVANELKPQFNLGKNGLTDTFIETVDKFLEAHGIVKIKVLAAEDKNGVKEIAEELAEALTADVIDKKGFTFVLYR